MVITRLQVRLNEVHKVDLFDEYIASPSFDKFATLKRRKAYIRSMETIFNNSHLKPKHINVLVHDGSVVYHPNI